jgi:ADP-ribosylglycohydrolase
MAELNVDRLNQKAVGSLVGVVSGDIHGLPVECQAPVAIRDKVGYVDEPISCKLHPYKSVARRAAGTRSDDSQLTFAMMDSLNRQGGYNIVDIQKAHVEAFDGAFGPPVGWGGSTKAAIEKMKAGNRVTAIPEGAGNGPVIKIAPLAIYCVYRCLETPHRRFTNSFNLSLLKKCREVSQLTHGDPACIVAAYCQARMIIRALQDELPKESPSIATLFIKDAEWVEQHLDSKDLHFAERLKSVLRWEIRIPVPEGVLNPGMIRSFDLTTGKMSAMICTDHSSYIYNSYPLVAYCVAKYLPYKNFRHALLETVNAGADADSNASMVGAIVGAHLGFDAIPAEMVKCTKDWTKVLVRIRHFVRHL